MGTFRYEIAGLVELMLSFPVVVTGVFAEV
jgi:hypothetical protein